MLINDHQTKNEALYNGSKHSHGVQEHCADKGDDNVHIHIQIIGMIE